MQANAQDKVEWPRLIATLCRFRNEQAVHTIKVGSRGPYFDKIQTVFKPHDGLFLEGERVFLSSIRSTSLMNAIKNPVYSCQAWRSEEEL